MNDADRSPVKTNRLASQPETPPPDAFAGINVISSFRDHHRGTNRFRHEDGRRHKLEDRIVATATSLFAASGYEGVTIRDIAKNASISLPTVYHFFDDKRDLYVECCLRLFAFDMATLEVVATALDDRAELVYGLSLTLNYIQASRRLSKLIHRFLLDEDLEIVELVGKQLSENNAIHRMVETLHHYLGPSKGARAFYAITGLAIGYNLQVPLQLLEANRSIESETPSKMTDYMLSLFLPELSWTEIGVSTRAKLGHILPVHLLFD